MRILVFVATLVMAWPATAQDRFTDHFPLPHGITSEAVPHMERILNSMITKCAQSWVKGGVYLGQLAADEYRGKFHYVVNRKSITQADMLNGLEWEYTVSAKFEGAERSYRSGPAHDNRWSSWRNRDKVPDFIPGGELSLRVWKLKGTIYYLLNPFSAYTPAAIKPMAQYSPPPALTCDQMPR
jgi:hypothetical protein